MYGATIVGGVAFAMLGVLEITQATAYFAALLFFFASLDMATADLLCEGKYAEKMMEKPETSSDLVSWVWGVYQLGSLTASVTGLLALAISRFRIRCVPDEEGNTRCLSACSEHGLVDADELHIEQYTIGDKQVLMLSSKK